MAGKGFFEFGGGDLDIADGEHDFAGIGLRSIGLGRLSQHGDDKRKRQNGGTVIHPTILTR